MKSKCIGFFGPTGSGKTTELNRVARENKEQYSISYSFQDNVLLENLTVLKNILLPLEHKFSKSEAESIAKYWIGIFDLNNKETVQCKNLSGGEKQRVNLARAFANDGDIFLFDEPFSSQDEEHKNQILKKINELKNRKKQIFLVSHEKKDLEILCDEIREFPL